MSQPASDSDPTPAPPQPVVSSGQQDRELLSAAMQTAAAVLSQRRRAERELLAAKKELEQRTAELSVAKARADRLALVAQRTTNAVIITDPEHRITWVNEAFCRLSGYTAEEALGKKRGELLHPELSDSQTVARLNAALAAGRGFRGELLKHGKSGHAYWADLDIQPLRDDQGELTGFMSIESDITALKIAQQRAEAASQAKSEFLANMSHEIRTPLTAILGYAELLRDGERPQTDPGLRVETIDTIYNAGQHLLTIINDILDLSKIEAGRMSVEAVETPLVRILAEIESLVGPRAAAKGVELRLVFETPVPAQVYSDPTRLRQILMNLTGNAVKFTEAGTVTVRVSVRQAPETLRLNIDVEDTGAGMTHEQSSLLFLPFSQTDATVTRQFGGTGLGLMISRRLARLLGGDVTLIRSAPGQGSIFRVELPVGRVAGSAEVSNARAAHQGMLTPPTPGTTPLRGSILLAEDGPDNQRLISFHLRRAGAAVDVAPNGRIALEMITRALDAGAPYNLLLTDIQMPEMDGYTLARKVRSLGVRMPIIALTAHAMPEDRERCRQAGCDDYASKPIDRASLLCKCGAWLTSSAESSGCRADD